MAGLALHQRCWNHESREAVCRCPRCGRCFCRECVTEHHARLLCAACLKAAAQSAQVEHAAWRRMLPAGMLLAGLFLSWAFFYGAGEALLEITARLEQASWQSP